MTQDQIILFALLGCIFGLLIWGRFRYDLIAFSALAVALVAGVVPKDAAFSGFGHPATVIIALVLIVSRGLFASGAGGFSYSQQGGEIIYANSVVGLTGQHLLVQFNCTFKIILTFTQTSHTDKEKRVVGQYFQTLFICLHGA